MNNSGKCCLLISLVLIIGLGICGIVFRDRIFHEYNRYWNSDNSTSLDKDTSVEEKDSKESTSSGEDSEELTTILVSTVSSTTMNYEETTTDLIFIDETSTTSNPIPSTISTIASTSTKSQSITTDDIYDGSGSGTSMNNRGPPIDAELNNDDYDNSSSGNGPIA